MHIPGAKAGWDAGDWNCHHSADTEVPELLVYAIQFVVVVQTETDLDGECEAHRAPCPSWRHAKLEIRPLGGPRVRLPIELERDESVRLERTFAERAAVIHRQLERNLLHGAEHRVRAGVGGVRRPETDPAAEPESQRGVEVRLVPKLPARSVGAGRAGVETVPGAEVHTNVLEGSITAEE